MKKLSKLLEQLIELNSIIKKIENRSTLKIISSDLDIFYEFSIMSVTDIEKAITESLIENALDKHNIILNNIKKKLIIYNDFQNKYQGVLEIIDLRNLIDDKLSFISGQIEDVKNELKSYDLELKELGSSISSSEHQTQKNVTDKLVEKETALKNEVEPIRKKYKELQKQKREQGNLKAIKYSQINFNKIADNFKTAITLCKVESDFSVKKSNQNDYLERLITHRIHKVFEDELFRTLKADDLHLILNLSDKDLSYNIPHNFRTKIYYLISQLDNHIKKRIKGNNWRDTILKKLKIDLKIYQKNKGKTASSTSPKDIRFADKVNNIFNEN